MYVTWQRGQTDRIKSIRDFSYFGKAFIYSFKNFSEIFYNNNSLWALNKKLFLIQTFKFYSLLKNPENL